MHYLLFYNDTVKFPVTTTPACPYSYNSQCLIANGVPGVTVIPFVPYFMSLDTTVYRVKDQFIGYDFLRRNWETFDDPSHRRVNYEWVGTMLSPIAWFLVNICGIVHACNVYH